MSSKYYGNNWEKPRFYLARKFPGSHTASSGFDTVSLLIKILISYILVVYKHGIVIDQI
jgi:hypothetical protein